MAWLDTRIRVDAGENPFRREFWTGWIDSRPVAAFRICFGALLLKDALFRLPLAELLYSDRGILPRWALLSVPIAPYRFSLMDAVGTPALAVAFFLAWALVAACLMLGYKTRLAVVLNYLILVSVQYRNPYVLDGSDAVFRVLGFWSLFLPLADHYSIDGRRRRLQERASGTGEAPPRAWALPVRLAQLQVAIIYLATAALKLRSGIWLGGDALLYTRQLESLLLPLGRAAFAAAPDALLRFGSVAALLIEWAFPFLVLSPIGQPALRIAGLGLGAALHAGIAATMSIANFSLLMISSYWLFVPGEWLDVVARRLGLVQGLVAPTLVPEPPARPGVARTLLGVALGSIMACVVWHNVWTVYYPLVPRPAGPARHPLLYLALWQNWDMFLSGGRRPDGWVQVVGAFEDGRVLDLDTHAPPSDEMPARNWGPWTRLKPLERVVDTLPPIHLQAWAQHYCARYDASRATAGRLTAVELRHRFRLPHGPGMPPNPLQTVVLWRQRCAPTAQRPRT